MHPPERSEKSYVVAVCLSAVFGVVGVQHFYLERYVQGFADLGMTLGAVTFFLRGQWLEAGLLFAVDCLHTLVVSIMLFTGSFRDGSGKLVCYPGQKLTR
ncbi:MAG: NINE protein [Planctomycetota bacterium]|jgi:TM2 domain-containing membrane protein YozV